MVTNKKINDNWLEIPIEIYRLNLLICINQSLNEVEEFGLRIGLGETIFTKEWSKSFNETKEIAE